jgi:hypothetical protein
VVGSRAGGRWPHPLREPRPTPLDFLDLDLHERGERDEIEKEWDKVWPVWEKNERRDREIENAVGGTTLVTGGVSTRYLVPGGVSTRD